MLTRMSSTGSSQIYVGSQLDPVKISARFRSKDATGRVVVKLEKSSDGKSWVEMNAITMDGPDQRASVNVDPGVGYFFRATVSFIRGFGANVTVESNAQVATEFGRLSKKRLLLIGDSLTGENVYTPNITAMSRAGNVVTATISAGHLFNTGDKLSIIGSTDPSFDEFETTITRVSSTVFRYANPGPDKALDLSSVPKCISIKFTNISGYYPFLNGKAGGAFELAGVIGLAGYDADQILAQVTRFIDLIGFDEAYVMAGINSLTGGATAADTAATVKAICQLILAKNKPVRLLSVLPVSSSNGTFATTKLKIVAMNKILADWAASVDGVRYVNVHKVLIDPSSATGDTKTGVLRSDGTHLNPKGAILVGTELYNSYNGTLPANPSFVSSQIENYGADNTNKNLWDSAPWSTSGGAKGSGITDAASPPGGATAGVADGFNVSKSGTGTGEVYVEPRSDGYGNNQVVVFTSGAASDSVTIQQEASSLLAGRVQSGKKYKLRCNWSISGMSGGKVSFYRMRIQFTLDGTTYNIGGPVTSVNFTGVTDSCSDFDLMVESDPMPMPPFTACTSGTIEWICHFGAAGTAITMKVGRVSFEEITE